MNERTDGLDGMGWTRMGEVCSECGAMAINVMFMPTLGPGIQRSGDGRLGLEPDSDSDSGPQIAFNYVACDCAPVFMPHC